LLLYRMDVRSSVPSVTGFLMLTLSGLVPCGTGFNGDADVIGLGAVRNGLGVLRALAGLVDAERGTREVQVLHFVVVLLAVVGVAEGEMPMESGLALHAEAGLVGADLGTHEVLVLAASSIRVWPHLLSYCLFSFRPAVGSQKV